MSVTEDMGLLAIEVLGLSTEQLGKGELEKAALTAQHALVYATLAVAASNHEPQAGLSEKDRELIASLLGTPVGAEA